MVGWPAVVALVLLRLCLGWHFLYQGIHKLQDPDFTSAAYLLQSKGPFAKHFRDLVPDADGRERLANRADRPKAWEALRLKVVDFYKLPPDRAEKTKAALDLRESEYKTYIASIGPEVELQLDDLKHLEELERSPNATVYYQQKRIWDKRQELLGKQKPWLAGMDEIEVKFQDDLVALLTPEEAKRPLPLPPPPLDFVNRVTIYSNIAIGVCLIVGLFTPLAALGGAAFLLLIVLAQPAWPSLYPPPHPAVGYGMIVNKEFIEMMALVVVAATPAGRWAGLDFFLYQLIWRPLFGPKVERKK